MTKGHSKVSLFKTFISTVIINNLISIVWWLFTERSLIQLSDKFFTVSVVIACVGVVISVTSKSRRHYYVHLKKKFSGKDDISDREFDEEQAKRDKHSQIGVMVGFSGLFGFAMSAAVLFLK